MEIRVLRYFLTVAREQSITKAAEYLHLSQPTLSRQLKDLEMELGKQLFVRGPKKIHLTEEGVFLRERAQEILDLMHKTENEIKSSFAQIEGAVYIGAGETKLVEWIGKAGTRLLAKYPKIKLHISSGDLYDIKEQLARGTIDFGILFDPFDRSEYDYLSFAAHDQWGVLMPKEDQLASLESIQAQQLWKLPLIISRQQDERSQLSIWMEKSWSELHVVATYSLLYNASLLVKEQMGYALCLDGIVKNEDLCFRKLEPPLYLNAYMVWKKDQRLTRAAQAFVEELEACMQNEKKDHTRDL